MPGGAIFAVWAPNAERSASSATSTAGTAARIRSSRAARSGIWEGFVPGRRHRARTTSTTSSRATTATASTRPTRSRFHHETPPQHGLDRLGPRLRLERRGVDGARARSSNALDAPMSIYEVHLGSWRRVPEDGNRSLSYREIAPPLAEYVQQHGLHARRAAAGHGAPVLRLLGLPDAPATSRRPAATARRRTSCTSIDYLHQHGIGVILDWVPSHFPDRRARPRRTSTARTSTSTPIRARASTPTGTATSSTTAATRCAASCSRSALFWLDDYHVDGLRVDAVASMLYLDYSRKARRVDPERVRRPREPRGDRLPAPAQRGRLRRASRRADDRRGVDGVADGVAADVRRRPRLRHEVGHGLDARHAALLRARPDPPQVPPQRADLPR